MSETNVRDFLQRTRTGTVGRSHYGMVPAHCGWPSDVRVPTLVVFNPGDEVCLKGCQSAGVKFRSAQQARWGLLQDISLGHRLPPPPPAWLSEPCWLCYANDERWISHFPQPGFAQLCIYYPPLKIRSPQRRGMAGFYSFASRVGTGLSSNHPGLWSAKPPFVVRCPHPPDCLQDTQRHLHASEQVISWFGKTCQPGWWKRYSICWRAIRSTQSYIPTPCPHSHLRMANTSQVLVLDDGAINHPPLSTSDTAFYSLVLVHQGLSLCLL